MSIVPKIFAALTLILGSLNARLEDERPPKSWTVGRGSFFDYSEIQDAIEKAQPGDRILVDPNTEVPYHQFEVTKPLTITSRGPEPFPIAWTGYGPGVTATISVRGLKGDEPIVLSHLLIAEEDEGAVALELSETSAPISVINCQFESKPTYPTRTAKLMVISDCSRVYLSELVHPFNPTCNLEIMGSHVELYRPRLIGASAFQYSLQQRVATIRASSSHLVLYGPRIEGGESGGNSQASIEGSAAIELRDGSTCRIIGLTLRQPWRPGDYLRGGDDSRWWECFTWGCCPPFCEGTCCWESAEGEVQGGPAIEAFGRSRAALSGVELEPGYYTVPQFVHDAGSSIVVRRKVLLPSLEKYDIYGSTPSGEPLQLLVRGEPGSRGTVYVSARPREDSPVADGLVFPSPVDEVKRVQGPYLVEKSFQLPAAGHLRLQLALPTGGRSPGQTIVCQARLSPPPGGDRRSVTWTNCLSTTIVASLGERVFFDSFPSTDLDPNNWELPTELTIEETALVEPSEPFVLIVDPGPGRPWTRDPISSVTIDLSRAREAFVVFSHHGFETAAVPGTLGLRFRNIYGTWSEVLRQPGGLGLPFSRVAARLPNRALHDNFAFRFAVEDLPSGIEYDHFVDDVALYWR